MLRIKDRGRGYPSWVGVLRPLRHWELGRGRDAVGSAGTRCLLASQREGLERIYEVLRTFLCFVRLACHGDE
jgi:hypothetical protein